MTVRPAVHRSLTIRRSRSLPSGSFRGDAEIFKELPPKGTGQHNDADHSVRRLPRTDDVDVFTFSGMPPRSQKAGHARDDTSTGTSAFPLASRRQPAYWDPSYHNG